MEKVELEFIQRFINIEKMDFTDFEKRISFIEMTRNMELNNNDISKILESLSNRVKDLMVKNK
jgi:hypothetical protein